MVWRSEVRVLPSPGAQIKAPWLTMAGRGSVLREYRRTGCSEGPHHSGRDGDNASSRREEARLGYALG